MKDVSFLFSFYGVAWGIKESDLLAKPRNWVMQRSEFMIHLLSCWYCVGFWAGVLVCLCSGESNIDWALPGRLLVWGCAGSAASAIGNALFEKLSLIEISDKENDQ